MNHLLNMDHSSDISSQFVEVTSEQLDSSDVAEKHNNELIAYKNGINNSSDVSGVTENPKTRLSVNPSLLSSGVNIVNNLNIQVPDVHGSIGGRFRDANSSDEDHITATQQTCNGDTYGSLVRVCNDSPTTACWDESSDSAGSHIIPLCSNNSGAVQAQAFHSEITLSATTASSIDGYLSKRLDSSTSNILPHSEASCNDRDKEARSFGLSPASNDLLTSVTSLTVETSAISLPGTRSCNEDELISELDSELTSHVTHLALADLHATIQRLKTSNDTLEERLKAADSRSQLEIAAVRQSVSQMEMQNKGLQKTIADQFNEIKTWKERVEANDKAARKAIEGYKQEHQANLDKVMKKYNECKMEKESMVVKYAQGETKIAQLNVQMEKLEVKLREKEKEKEALAESNRNLKMENTSLATSLSEKTAELSMLRKSIEDQKEALSSNEYRSKWANNKLKSELDAHKDTKQRLEEVTRRYKESKEECLQIRENCLQMIKTYQESEEIKSNSLNLELKRKESDLNEQLAKVATLSQELASERSANTQLSAELKELKQLHSTVQAKLANVESSVTIKSQDAEDLQLCITSLREENSQIRNKLEEMNSLCLELEMKKSDCNELRLQIMSLELSHKDLLGDIESCKNRETEMLTLTQKMTGRNAELQSENSVLKAKVVGLDVATHELVKELEKLRKECEHTGSSHEEEKRSHQRELQQWNTILSDKELLVKKLHADLEALDTEFKAMKKKQSSSIKELTREVHTLRRQLEAYESLHTDEGSAAKGGSAKHGGSAPVSLRGSRTNSVSSLDKADSGREERNGSPAAEQRGESKQKVLPKFSSDLRRVPELQSSDSLEPHFLEPDKQKLIEKIVKLQRAHARKNEKLDFCEDHIRQLIEEVQRKTKIIQSYIMKEEAGALSSDAMDRNKDTMAKKGGIMASISSQHSQDSRLSLDFSLQINHKLQAVLEDSLLKNITLKENMDTLGHEIGRLSEENRQLKARIEALDQLSGS